MPKQRNYMVNSPHLYSVFFAPRGNRRMLELGMQIAQQYLDPEDKLIGIIGEAGAGKSMLIKGMFPGLDLCNDDSGINVRPLPILDVDEDLILITWMCALSLHLHKCTNWQKRPKKPSRRDAELSSSTLNYCFVCCKPTHRFLSVLGSRLSLPDRTYLDRFLRILRRLCTSPFVIVRWRIPQKTLWSTACPRNFSRSAIMEISRGAFLWDLRKNRISTSMR